MKTEIKHPKVFSENGNQLFFDEQGNLIKEEPKQETLEERAARYNNIKLPIPYGYVGAANDFINGAKWQSERMYSEEDLHNAFYNGWLYRGENYSFPKAKKEWFKQFKKK